MKGSLARLRVRVMRRRLSGLPGRIISALLGSLSLTVPKAECPLSFGRPHRWSVQMNCCIGVQSLQTPRQDHSERPEGAMLFTSRCVPLLSIGLAAISFAPSKSWCLCDTSYPEAPCRFAPHRRVPKSANSVDSAMNPSRQRTHNRLCEPEYFC
jgi:hypothetical protein